MTAAAIVVLAVAVIALTGLLVRERARHRAAALRLEALAQQMAALQEQDRARREAYELIFGTRMLPHEQRNRRGLGIVPVVAGFGAATGAVVGWARQHRAALVGLGTAAAVAAGGVLLLPGAIGDPPARPRAEAPMLPGSPTPGLGEPTSAEPTSSPTVEPTVGVTAPASEPSDDDSAAPVTSAGPTGRAEPSTRPTVGPSPSPSPTLPAEPSPTPTPTGAAPDEDLLCVDLVGVCLDLDLGLELLV